MTAVDNGRPPARVLALRPDGYRPGPIDLTVLDQTDWADLKVAPVSESLPTLVRALVAARDNDGQWAYLMWEEVMGAIVHQGTCYPATAPMMPVLAELAISSGLTAARRLDLFRALALTADQANIDAIYDAPTRIERWAAEAHTAVGEALPRLLERWQHEPVAIQFVLAVLAGLYPGQGPWWRTRSPAWPGTWPARSPARTSIWRTPC